MTNNLNPISLWRVPTLSSDFFEDLEELLPTYGKLNGLSVYEDDKNVYVEAAVPGLSPKDVDVTFDKGLLTIRGEKKEEEKEDRKYYRRATTSFFYRVTPGNVDPNVEPSAVCKNGIMSITFAKSVKVQPKKILVRTQ